MELPPQLDRTISKLAEFKEMQCTQDTIHSEDVIVLGNGREISMVKFFMVEQSRVPLAAVHANEVMTGSNCRKEMECTQDSIQAGDVMVFGNGREVSMVKFSVEESPFQNACASSSTGMK